MITDPNAGLVFFGITAIIFGTLFCYRCGWFTRKPKSDNKDVEVYGK